MAESGIIDLNCLGATYYLAAILIGYTEFDMNQ